MKNVEWEGEATLGTSLKGGSHPWFFVVPQMVLLK